jgi:hypothetical protein
MRSRVPDMPLALTMLWVWIGIVAVSVAGWWLQKWWKRRRCCRIRSGCASA